VSVRQSARSRQLSGKLGVDRQVEIGGAEVDEVARLAFDGGRDARVCVAGRRDGDAGGEIEKMLPSMSSTAAP
jgi:hypothetical protein